MNTTCPWCGKPLHCFTMNGMHPECADVAIKRTDGTQATERSTKAATVGAPAQESSSQSSASLLSVAGIEQAKINAQIAVTNLRTAYAEGNVAARQHAETQHLQALDALILAVQQQTEQNILRARPSESVREPDQAATESEAGIREIVIQAVANWCQFTHGHSSEKASLKAASAALLLAKARSMRVDAYDIGEVVVTVEALDHLLAELSPPTTETP